MNRKKTKFSILLLIIVMIICGNQIIIRRTKSIKKDIKVINKNTEQSVNKNNLLTIQNHKEIQAEQKEENNYIISESVQEQKQIYDYKMIQNISEESEFEKFRLIPEDDSVMSLLQKSNSVTSLLNAQNNTDNGNIANVEEVVTEVHATARKDEMVEAAQIWYNSNYAGRYGLEAVEVTGRTGHTIVNALISALQVELGITEPTGYFGQMTTQLLQTKFTKCT